MIKISLKSARTNAELTQKEAAIKSGLSLYAVKLAEKHPERISYETLVKLCDAYNIPVDQIFLLKDFA